MAVSRPEPGPFTNTSTLRMPCSIARLAAASAAICAANGVDLREPLKPTCPADAQAITLPAGSVMDTIVLLNVLLMWACPCETFFFSLRRTFLTPAPVRDFGGMSGLVSYIAVTDRLRGLTSYRPSSCRRPSSSDPYGCERWSSCADRERAGCDGAAGPRSSRSRSCGGCLPQPHGG